MQYTIKAFTLYSSTTGPCSSVNGFPRQGVWLKPNKDQQLNVHSGKSVYGTRTINRAFIQQAHSSRRYHQLGAPVFCWILHVHHVNQNGNCQRLVHRGVKSKISVSRRALGNRSSDDIDWLTQITAEVLALYCPVYRASAAVCVTM